LFESTIISSPSLAWPRHRTVCPPGHAHACLHKNRQGDATQNLPIGL
jgi:hypothetical protein